MNVYERLKNRTVEQVADDILNDQVDYDFCNSRYCPHAAEPDKDCRGAGIIPGECRKAVIRYLLSEVTPEKYNPSCNVNILHQERTGEPLNCFSCEMECDYKKEVESNGLA